MYAMQSNDMSMCRLFMDRTTDWQCIVLNLHSKYYYRRAMAKGNSLNSKCTMSEHRTVQIIPHAVICRFFRVHFMHTAPNNNNATRNAHTQKVDRKCWKTKVKCALHLGSHMAYHAANEHARHTWCKNRLKCMLCCCSNARLLQILFWRKNRSQQNCYSYRLSTGTATMKCQIYIP